MSKGGTPKQQTVTNKQEPWAPAQPYLVDLLGKAQSQYSQPREYFPGSTVVPFSQATRDSLGGIEARARGGSDVNRALQDQLKQTLGGGYMNNQGPSQDFYNNVLGGGVQNNRLGGLEAMAQGGQNPWLDNAFDRAASKVRSNVDRSFSLSGRGGSLENQKEMTNGLNDLATQIYGGAYEGDAARRLSASSQLAGFGDSDISRMFGAASGLDNNRDSERQRQIQAMMFAPQAANQDYADLERLGGVGQEREGQYGRYLQDAISRFDFNRDDPFNQLNNYASLLQGLGASGGTSTQTQPLYRQGGGGLGSALGTISSIASIASMFSDRRVKTDIELVTSGEIPTYHYRYIWDEPGTQRLGVMADEVEKVLPDAVHEVAGVKAVDYAMVKIAYPDMELRP